MTMTLDEAVDLGEPPEDSPWVAVDLGEPPPRAIPATPPMATMLELIDVQQAMIERLLGMRADGPGGLLEWLCNCSPNRTEMMMSRSGFRHQR